MRLTDACFKIYSPVSWLYFPSLSPLYIPSLFFLPHLSSHISLFPSSLSLSLPPSLTSLYVTICLQIIFHLKEPDGMPDMIELSSLAGAGVDFVCCNCFLSESSHLQSGHSWRSLGSILARSLHPGRIIHRCHHHFPLCHCVWIAEECSSMFRSIYINLHLIINFY